MNGNTDMTCLQNKTVKLNLRRSRGFSPAQKFSQSLQGFAPGYEGTVNVFYSFYKNCYLRYNKDKDKTRSAYLYIFIYFMKLSVLTTWREPNHVVHFIFVIYSAMKIQLLTNQNARTFQNIL